MHKFCAEIYFVLHNTTFQRLQKMSLLVKGSVWKVGWRSDCVFMRMRYSRPGQRVPLCPTITASHFTPLGNIRRCSLHTCTYNTCSVHINHQILFSARSVCCVHCIPTDLNSDVEISLILLSITNHINRKS